MAEQRQDAIRIDEALARLARIEAVLGSLLLTGMTRKQQAAVTEAWWESRADVPRDDDLRDLALSEFKGFIHVDA